jgi:predicted nucleotidyltransferase
MHPALRRRLDEQERLVETARTYVDRLRDRFSLEAAWVAGSVARGDFNLWSDVDVVLIVHELPRNGLERLDLFLDAPARVQVIPYTPVEFQEALLRKDPLATEAVAEGIALVVGPRESPTGSSS